MVLLLQRVNTMMTFGEKVRALRKARGWTQENLSEKTGYSKPYISRIENDDIGFSIEAGEKIAEAFDISLPLLMHPEIDIDDLDEVATVLSEFAKLPPEKRKAVYQMILAMRS